MKVLFFSHQAEFVYGGEVVTLAYMKELRKAGVDVFFASPVGPYQERAKKFVPTFTVTSRQFSRRWSLLPALCASLWRSHRELSKIIGEQRITHLHVTSLKAMVYAWCLGFRLPVLWHHHDILPIQFTNRLWLRFLAFSARAILVPSQATGNALLAAGVSRKKIQVLNNGFCLSDWRKRKPKSQERHWSVLLLGEISHRKGTDRVLDLLRVFLDLGAKKGEVEIRIAGAAQSDPRWAEDIQKTIRQADLHAWVTFLGRVENVGELMQTTDLLFVPSRQDPLPTVIIEAALSGVPVLAHPVGGIPEMVGPEKIGFLGASPEEYKKVLLGLEDTAAWLVASERSYQFAAKNYNLETLTKKLREIYLSSATHPVSLQSI